MPPNYQSKKSQETAGTRQITQAISARLSPFFVPDASLCRTMVIPGYTKENEWITRGSSPERQFSSGNDCKRLFQVQTSRLVTGRQLHKLHGTRVMVYNRKPIMSCSHASCQANNDNSRSASTESLVNLNSIDDRQLFPWTGNWRREGIVISEGPERRRGRSLVSGFAYVHMWKCRWMEMECH